MRADYPDVLRETVAAFGYFLSLRVAYSVLLDTVSGDLLIPLGWVGAGVCISHVQTLFREKNYC